MLNKRSKAWQDLAEFPKRIFLAQGTPEPSAGSNVEKAAEKYKEALRKLSELHADADCYPHQAASTGHNERSCILFQSRQRSTTGYAKMAKRKCSKCSVPKCRLTPAPHHLLGFTDAL